MVGTLRLGGGNYGLVQTKDGLVHRVLPGNHLGQNDGRIMSVERREDHSGRDRADGLGGLPRAPRGAGLDRLIFRE